jgi:hypothetical protein
MTILIVVVQIGFPHSSGRRFSNVAPILTVVRLGIGCQDGMEKQSARQMQVFSQTCIFIDRIA